MSTSTILFVLFVLFCFTVYTSTADTPPRVRVISGSYIRKLPPTHIYTGTTQLLFDINFNISTPQLVPLNCKTEKTERSCQVAAATREFLSGIRIRLEHLQSSIFASAPSELPYANRTRRSLVPNPLNFISDVASWCCGYATQRDLASLTSNANEMTRFLRTLKQSVIIDHQNLLKVKDSFANFNNQLNGPIAKIQKILNNTIRFQEAKDRNVSVELLHLETMLQRSNTISLNIAQYVTWLTEINHYQDIMQHCRNRLIPMSAIHPTELQKELSILQTDLHLEGYELAINPEHVYEYYRHKLVDCSFSSNRILVQLRVPFRKRDQEWILYESINVPFIFQGSSCSIRHSPTYLAVSDDQIVSIQGTHLDLCKPYDGLCLISQFNPDPYIGYKCAEQLFRSASVSKLNDVCSFECTRNPSQETFITQLNFHTYAITNAPPESKVICKYGRQDRITSLYYPNTVGAVEVTLPCKCVIVIPGRPTISPPFPCPSSISTREVVHIVIPAAWSKLDVVLNSHAPIYSETSILNSYPNLSACLNENWNLHTPVINITAIHELEYSKVPPLIRVVPKAHSWLMIGWNLILTIFLLILGYKLCSPAVGFMAFMPAPTHALTSDEMQHQLNILIAFVVILDLIVLLLAAILILFCISRWMRRMAQKQQDSLDRTQGTLLRPFKSNAEDLDDPTHE